MNDFFTSPFVKNLSKGELPEVPISLEKSTLVNMAITIILCGIILIFLNKVISKK